MLQDNFCNINMQDQGRPDHFPDGTECPPWYYKFPAAINQNAPKTIICNSLGQSKKDNK